jgi:hypothetical protein
MRVIAFLRAVLELCCNYEMRTIQREKVIGAGCSNEVLEFYLIVYFYKKLKNEKIIFYSCFLFHCFNEKLK